MIECSYCHKRYIGETGLPVNVRLNGHRADTAKKLPKVVAQHFNEAGHNLDDLTLHILQSSFRSARDRKCSAVARLIVLVGIVHVLTG
uniref:Tick transposon n=1 Tax=Rhipicephalus appendiculatus TaxID=34631 RepID=A0A131YYH1_RHIAP